MEKVHILGIGDDGLEGLAPSARELIERADLIIGDEQELGSLADVSAEKVAIGANIEEVGPKIEQNPDRRTVVLATGDPLFYGIARYLIDRIGKERFIVVPHVSTMQLAFARVMESWDEAYLTNLATQNLDHVVEKIRTAEKAGLFTTEQSPPAAVARALLDRKIDYFSCYVCENLGSPDERVTQGELAEVAEQEFSPLNVMVLLRKADLPDRPIELQGRRLFGNPDETFFQSHPKRGLLTPSEVRTMALAEMDLGPTSVIWDVGAGSGSVAIEAAQIASGGRAYAIELDPEDHQLISRNVERFAVKNVVPILGRAPDAWADLPDPDAVFVGGTGRTVSRIVELAIDRLKPRGRIVINVGSVENVAAVREVLHRKTGDASVWMVNIARGAYQLERMRFESMNPTFLLAAVKT